MLIKCRPAILSISIALIISSVSATEYSAPLTGNNLILESGDKVTYDGASYITGINSSGGLTVNGSIAVDLTSTGGVTAFQTNNGTYNLGSGSIVDVTSTGGAIFEVGYNTTIVSDKLNVNFNNTVAGAQANFIHSTDSNMNIKLNESNIVLTNVNGVDIGGGNNIIDFGNNSTINSTMQNDGVGIFSSQTIFYIGGSNNTIRADKININMNIVSDENHGGVISLSGNSNIIDLGTGSTLSVNTNNEKQTTTGIIVSGLDSSVIAKDSTINLNLQKGATALESSGPNSKIDLSGKMNIVGLINASGPQSEIKLVTTDGSRFTGSSSVQSNAAFNFNMNNSVWNMTDDSKVTNLVLNGSTVRFAKDSFETLNTDTLQGNGVFDIRTDIVSNQGDLIVVNGLAEGNHKLNVTNNGAAQTDGTETLTVIKTGTNRANFTLANSVELGGYEYGLRTPTASANDVELYSTGKVSTTAKAATSFLNIGYLTSYIENQTLLQRLGDLRNNPQGSSTRDGLWIKGYGGKLSAFSGSALGHFDMTYMGRS